MIKLVACDIDGTVLEQDEKFLPGELLAQAERLIQKGIVFSFSSGRQFSNLRVLADRLADRFYYICDNGAVTFMFDHQWVSVANLYGRNEGRSVRLVRILAERPKVTTDSLKWIIREWKY